MRKRKMKPDPIGRLAFQTRCQLRLDAMNRVKKLEHLNPDGDEVRNARFLCEQITQSILKSCDQIVREGIE
ncbi:hypothetical protein OAK91_02900 [Planctomycetaceae bacterium]|nr:hypothetical protein [Planctomycetaceae bacterium]